MIVPETCSAPECDEPVFCGVGEPVAWVCARHFHVYLGEAMERVRRILTLVSAREERARIAAGNGRTKEDR